MSTLRPTEAHFPLNIHAAHFITSTYKKPTWDDMVRVVHIFPDNRVQRSSECFLASFDTKPADNVRDQAMVDALISNGAWWPDTDAINTLTCYKDAHGIWCVECGNGVVTAEDGGHVCHEPTCKNFEQHRVPAWVKERYNLA
jgi:hypothetical protein